MVGEDLLSGMRAAGAHAEAVHSGWISLAVDGLRRFALGYGKPFTIEQARAGLTDIPPPRDLRSWGAATTAALNAGVIEPTRSYGPARSSNGAAKRKYQPGLAAFLTPNGVRS